MNLTRDDREYISGLAELLNNRINDIKQRECEKITLKNRVQLDKLSDAYILLKEAGKR